MSLAVLVVSWSTLVKFRSARLTTLKAALEQEPTPIMIRPVMQPLLFAIAGAATAGFNHGAYPQDFSLVDPPLEGIHDSQEPPTGLAVDSTRNLHLTYPRDSGETPNNVASTVPRIKSRSPASSTSRMSSLTLSASSE